MINLVQHTVSRNYPVSSETATVSATGVGNLIVVIATGYQGANTGANTTWTVTDNSGSNVYTLAPNTFNYDHANPNWSVAIFYCANAASCTTVTATPTNGGVINGIACGVYEYSGAATTSPVDDSNNADTSSATTSQTGPTLTTTNAADVLVSASVCTNSLTGVNSPYGNFLDPDNVCGMADYQPGVSGSISGVVFTGANPMAGTVSTAAFLPGATSTPIQASSFLVF